MTSCALDDAGEMFTVSIWKNKQELSFAEHKSSRVIRLAQSPTYERAGTPEVKLPSARHFLPKPANIEY